MGFGGIMYNFQFALTQLIIKYYLNYYFEFVFELKLQSMAMFRSQ